MFGRESYVFERAKNICGPITEEAALDAAFSRAELLKGPLEGSVPPRVYIEGIMYRGWGRDPRYDF